MTKFKKLDTKKNAFKKPLLSIINVLITEGRAKGCFYYSITLKFPKESYISILSKQDRDVLLQDSLLDVSRILDRQSDKAFYAIRVEASTNRIPVIKIFLAIRNIIGNNLCISLNIQQQFLDHNFFDIELRECIGLLSPLRGLQDIFSELYSPSDDLLKPILVTLQPFWSMFHSLEAFVRLHNLTLLIEKTPADSFTPNFLSVENTQDTKTITYENLVHLVRVYFESQKWFVCYDNNIYAEIPGSLFSVRFVKKLANFCSLFEDIMVWSHKHHWLIFNGFDFLTMKTKYLSQLAEILNKAPGFILPSAVITSELIEFKNGVYIRNLNTFLKNSTRDPFTRIEKTRYIFDFFKKTHLKTISFYNQNFSNRKLPRTWLSIIDGKDLVSLDSFFSNFDRNIIIRLVQELQRNSIIQTTFGISSEELKKNFALEQIRALLPMKNMVVPAEDTMSLFKELPWMIIYCRKLLLKKKTNLSDLFKIIKACQT